MKYSVSTFSRFLLGLLAVFYVSIFVIDATHAHESLVEAVSMDGEKDGPETTDCKICAYFAHHENELIAVVPTSAFVLFLFQAELSITSELTSWYPASLRDFINRGPPFPFV